MNLAWTFGDLPAQSCTDQNWRVYPMIGQWVNSGAGYHDRLFKVFQPFTSCCLLHKDRLAPRGASNTSADFADPLAVCCGSLNALD